MQKELKMDDIRVGMYITVLQGKVDTRIIPGHDGPVKTFKERDNYNGKVLEVISLEMPYAVVKIHEMRGVRTDSIDLRKIEVMGLSREYITSLLPNLVPHGLDHFWDDVDLESVERMDATIDEVFEKLNTK